MECGQRQEHKPGQTNGEQFLSRRALKRVIKIPKRASFDV
jgi:hypothetical protein